MKKISSLLLLFFLICEAYGRWDLNAPCAEAGASHPIGEGFRAHPNDRECQKYIACVGNIGHERQCLGNHHFDRCTENRCVSPSELDCDDRCVLCPLTGIANFPSDSPNQCHEYYLCVNGQQLKTKCANGMLFDRETRTCRPFQEVTNCRINTCLITENFEFAFAPDLSDCRKFFVCENGRERFYLTCAAGRKYSMHQKDRIGDVEFYGRCVDDSDFVKCFNGQNFPKPRLVQPDCEKDPNQPGCEDDKPDCEKDPNQPGCEDDKPDCENEPNHPECEDDKPDCENEPDHPECKDDLPDCENEPDHPECEDEQPDF